MDAVLPNRHNKLHSREPMFHQVLASFIEHMNTVRLQKRETLLSDSYSKEWHASQKQDEAFRFAFQQVNKVREFLQDPSKILGSDKTKHGEIAEQVEVHVRNAYAILKGMNPLATFDGVGRTAPEDYLINGVPYQSKFINGAINNLTHVLKHMEKYNEFGRDGSKYMIPKDVYELVTRLRDGEPVGFRGTTELAILQKVKEIESLSGQSFSDIIKPSISTYGDVQQATVASTLGRHEDVMIDQQQLAKEDIHHKAEQEREKIKDSTSANIRDGLGKAAIAGGIAAGVDIVASIYKKTKDGKPFSSFTSDDWKEIGWGGAKKGTKGALTAGSIYVLTNLTHMGAPMAGAVTTSIFGFSSLYMDYQNGHITLDNLVTDSQVLCFEAGVSALAAAAGQTLIPVPVLGAAIGVLTADVLLSFSNQFFAKGEKEFAEKLERLQAEAIQKLNEEHKKILEDIVDKYEEMGRIIDMAFDVSINVDVRLANSANFARSMGVLENQILISVDDIDAYFLT
ncbi:hypothetical protein ACQVPL_16915 [Bacillus hominis]|uniref:hypothetical protein n=1 Tax=Bacillus cereus group TaxID=86661 RepID=UPI001038B49E|nr:hypothetical protein [Bacillus wiedmannii]TCD31185.1 hypothetical protein E0D84_19480 [Bacillus wiedmannii]